MSQQTKAGKHKVVTLCGSRRFADKFRQVAEELTLEGAIVLRPEFISDDKWASMSSDEMIETYRMLTEMHLRRIDMADEVHVIDVGGYVGCDTQREISYAERTGKPVTYLEHPTFCIMTSKMFLASDIVIVRNE